MLPSSVVFFKGAESAPLKISEWLVVPSAIIALGTKRESDWKDRVNLSLAPTLDVLVYVKIRSLRAKTIKGADSAPLINIR